jgi:hypothetical protein
MENLLVEPPDMADKAKTVSVKLPIDVIDSARIVAALRNQAMSDLMSDILRPALARMERKELARRSQEWERKGSAGPSGSNK